VVGIEEAVAPRRRPRCRPGRCWDRWHRHQRFSNRYLPLGAGEAGLSTDLLMWVIAHLVASLTPLANWFRFITLVVLEMAAPLEPYF